jgi:hypothetical protein
MSRKHFFLYDFLLPLIGVLMIGRFFSDHFDTFLFHKLDTIKAFGLGQWFGHSSIRQTLWDYSWLTFAIVPALAWMVWVRINMEYDWVNGRRRLDRPIFTFFLGLARWIEGGGEVQMVRQAYERRLAIELDRARRLEAELAAANGTGAPFESATETGEEWRDGYAPPSPQG